MNKQILAICDVIALFALGWILHLERYGLLAIAASSAVVAVSMIPFFFGVTRERYLGMWLVRCFGIAVIGLWVGDRRIPMYAGLAACALLVLLAIFWPKKKVADQSAEDEAKQAIKKASAPSKSSSQQGHALVHRPSPFWAWVGRNAWGIASFLFLLAAIATVGTMVYQVMYGNMYDWKAIVWKAGIMFACLATAYACFLTQTDGWREALSGAGTFATERVAPAVGKAGGNILGLLGKGLRTLVLLPFYRLWLTLLTVGLLCFAAQYAMKVLHLGFVRAQMLDGTWQFFQLGGQQTYLYWTLGAVGGICIVLSILAAVFLPKVKIG